MDQDITFINEKIKEESLLVDRIILEMEKVIIGQRPLLERMVISVLLSIDTSKQTCPGRKTLGGIVKLGKSHTLLSQHINIGSLHFTPVASQVGPTHIICTD